jgi:N utilization substance protein B
MTQTEDSLSVDPRHQRRVDRMQALFAYGFSNSYDHVEEDHVNTIKEIAIDIPQIDELLQSAAPERPLQEINKVDLAILRLIMFESRHKKTPKKVLLDEAVELAKEFGTESSPAFVNGVLGKLLISDAEPTLES